MPILWDKNGRTYWRLKGGSDRSVVLLQGKDFSNTYYWLLVDYQILSLKSIILVSYLNGIKSLNILSPV